MPDTGLDLPPTDPGDRGDASDADRARVIETLRAAGASIGLPEAERRMDLALRSQSRAELALLVWDLPAGLPERRGQPGPNRTASVWRSTAFRVHAAAYGLVNGMLVGIWALTDSHGLFWPFFPIAGWGVGLGMQAVVTRGGLVRRREKEERLAREAGRKSPGHPELKSPNGAARATRVTVMFTDVVDSTRLTMVIGDEDWTRLRSRYRSILHDCYSRFGGVEVNSAGDGFLSRFDQPQDAVGCAVQIQKRLNEQREQLGFAPAVRIGINAGNAMEVDGDVLGTVVNLASRVTAAAGPHEILLTEAVADGLDASFRLEDGGLREMKGLNRTCHVLSVKWD